MKIRKGDKVKILSGKDRGKVGSVMAIFRKRNKLIVEGANFAFHFEKRKDEKNKGGVIKSEAPVSISKVQVLNLENKPSRVGFEIKDGKKSRVFKRKSK